MRLKKLIMSAFSPYADKAEVDFEAFGPKGLLLISGETGAGKTTIFDGISYALFGEVSGESRGINGLRSDFARAETPTFVNLVFEHRGVEYEIERSPEYLRPKKRSAKGGMTVQSAVAKLILPGRVIDKRKEVDDKIHEILGIDHQQFKQIVMIAQGEFLRLLLAGSKERGEILRKVFSTDLFHKIQDRLKEKSNHLEKKRKEIEASIYQYYGDIKCSAAEKQEAVEALIESVHNLPEVLFFLEQFLEELENTNKRQQKEKSRINQKAEELTKKLTLIEELNKAIRNIAAGEKEAADKKLLAAAAKEKYEALKQQEPIRTELGRAISEIEKALPKYRELQEKQQEYTAQEKEQKQCRKRYDAAAKEAAEAKDHQIQIAEELELLKDIEVEKTQITHEIEKLAEVKQKLEELQSEQEQCDQQDTVLDQLKNELEFKETQYRECNDTYIEMERLFRAEQAGILAESLAPGKPCPVCGAAEHPKPAQKSVQSPTQKELEEQNHELEEKRSEANKLSQKIGSLKVQNETRKETILKNIRAFHGDQEISLEVSLSRNKKEYTALLIRKESIDEKWNRRNKIQERQKELSGSLEEKEKNALQLQAQLVKLEKDNGILQAEIKNLKANLIYKSEAEAETGKFRKETELSNLIKELDSSERSYRQLEEQTARTEAAVESSISNRDQFMDKLQITVTPSEEVDKVMVEEEKRAVESKWKRMEERIGSLALEAETNKRIYHNLKKNAREYETTEALSQEIKDIAATANGELTGGRQKITFETYVQQVYFERVLAEANKRFCGMTDGRYTLVRREDSSDLRSKTGLDLDVFDAWTGKDRAVQTLSGGESFKASLALALGLSDVVQSFSGGIVLDTMFIDEGFGTLDSESLDKAIDIIAELANGDRLVGIISHVDELKERIDNKLMIERDKQGSKIRVEL